MGKYSVSVGSEFELSDVTVEDVAVIEKIAAIEDRRRLVRRQGCLTYLVLGVFAVAFFSTSIIGWWDGTYNELSAVWMYGSFWVGLVLNPHFKKES